VVVAHKNSHFLLLSSNAAMKNSGFSGTI